MSNGTTESQEATRPTDSPVDVSEAQAQQAIEEAKQQAVELAKDLADLVMQQQGPPGTPSLRKR